MGRFTQADSIVPGSDTSQALNRYAYVKNNPLKFTDPDGHGWFSKAWKQIKGWIGTIATIALTPWLGPLAPIVGSAIGTLVNGGTFKSFAIGVAIGFAAGAIAGGLGSAMNGGSFGAGVGSYLNGVGIECIVGNFAAGAITGAVAGGISSAIYGGNWGKNMLAGAAGSAIGAGVAMATRAILSSPYMKSTIEFIKNMAETPLGRAIQLPFAIAGDLIFGPLATGTLTAGSERGPISDVTVKAYRLNAILGNDWTPNGNEIHCSIDSFNGLKNAIDNKSSGFTWDDSFYLSHFSHELGHIQRFREMGAIKYLFRDVLHTFPAQRFGGSYGPAQVEGFRYGVVNQRGFGGINRYENNATGRAAHISIDSFEVNR